MFDCRKFVLHADDNIEIGTIPPWKEGKGLSTNVKVIVIVLDTVTYLVKGTVPEEEAATKEQQ